VAAVDLARLRRVALAAVLATLGLILALLAPDLLHAIPWPIRRSAGRLVLALLAAFALRHLIRHGAQRPGDCPSFAQSPELNATVPLAPQALWQRTLSRLLALALMLACLATLQPLLRIPDATGFGDWDLFLGKYEAVRQSILLWHQWPWWDPWTRGGFPLAANPQCGVVGVATPLVLAFGTSIGLRLATVVCFLLAAEGARRLGRLWLGDPLAAAATGLIYALNGAVLVAAIAAYHVSMCYPVLPWILLCTFQLDRHPKYGLALGFWLAFNILNGIQYFSVYYLIVLAPVWLWTLSGLDPRQRSRFLVHTALALGTFLALAGWRIATVAAIYADFPRRYATGWNESLLSLWRDLIGRPGPDVLRRMAVPQFWETTTYIGPIVLALALASLAWGLRWRWWHTLAALCGWLAVGNIAVHHLSYWLGPLPLFASMHVVTRWRFVALLGVALAAADVIGRLHQRPNRRARWSAWALLILIATDYLSYAFTILPVAFSEPLPTRNPVQSRPYQIIQKQSGPGLPSVRAGFGVIQGFEPLMGYDRSAPTARLWLGHPDYLFEFWTIAPDGRKLPFVSVDWSPNRIVLRAQPGQTIFINQNPGSDWLVNGRRPHPDWRSAEMLQPFEVHADARGLVVAEIQPPALQLGLGLHALGLIIVAGGLAWTWRRSVKTADAAGSTES
jgi:hypothetical protein